MNITSGYSSSITNQGVGQWWKAEFEEGITTVTNDSCEIHTFDMIVFNKRHGYFNKTLSALGVTFHPWGLGTINQARRYPETYKTLAQTIVALGHEGRKIDIFKIDCEWCEWDTFRQWISSSTTTTTTDNNNNNVNVNIDITQLLVETHNAPMPNAANFFYELHDAGYVIFNKEANYLNGAGGVEFAFLKLSTDFFINGTTYNNLNLLY